MSSFFQLHLTHTQAYLHGNGIIKEKGVMVERPTMLLPTSLSKLKELFQSLLANLSLCYWLPLTFSFFPQGRYLRPKPGVSTQILPRPHCYPLKGRNLILFKHIFYIYRIDRMTPVSQKSINSRENPRKVLFYDYYDNTNSEI